MYLKTKKMKHLKDFKKIISYDFDGTLHLTVNAHGHPLDYYLNILLLKPNWPTINQLKEDALTHRIIVVSARNYGDEAYIESFCKNYKLPVDGVFCTNDLSKRRLLQSMSVVKHYDDNLKVKQDLEGSGVEFSLPIY